MEKIFKEVELIKVDGSVEMIKEEVVEVTNENGKKELVFKGLLEKEKNAEEIFLKRLKNIGINSIEEYNDIKYPEEFSLKVRHEKLKSNNLEYIQESEKSERFKGIEKLEKEIELEHFGSLIQSKATGYHSCNNTNSIIATSDGNRLYPAERCIWFEGGDRVMILRSNGTFGYDYVSQSSSRLTQLKNLVLHAMDYCLRLRGSRVEIADLNNNYLGWLNYKDSVKGHYVNVAAYFKSGNTTPSLAQIAGYWINFEGVTTGTGTFYPYHGFVRTNIMSASGGSTYCMYGTK